MKGGKQHGAQRAGVGMAVQRKKLQAAAPSRWRCAVGTDDGRRRRHDARTVRRHGPNTLCGKPHSRTARLDLGERTSRSARARQPAIARPRVSDETVQPDGRARRIRRPTTSHVDRSAGPLQPKALDEPAAESGPAFCE